MSRIEPLSPATTPELAETFAAYEKALGFVPNSVLIMQRRPKMVKALGASPRPSGIRTARCRRRSSACSRTSRAAPTAASTAWRIPRAAR